MNQSLPSMFIGSSSQGLAVAEAIQLALENTCDATLWTQGVYGLGEGTLEALVNALGKFDYAVLVLTPDDLTTIRGTTSQTPRDNVLFELGLFMGRIGPRRTFIVCEQGLRLPSDLAGVTVATYRLHNDGNLQSSLGPAMTKVRSQIKKQDVFSDSPSNQTSDQGTCQADWKISARRTRKIGADIKARDASNLFFVFLSVVDCHRSRIAIGDLQAETFDHVTIEAAYDLMGAWDLLVKFRAESNSIANDFYQKVVERLVLKRMMENSEIASFGKKKLINILAQSRTIRTLITPSDDEIITYVLLPDNSDYDKFRTSRSFIFVEARGKKGSKQRKVFLKELNSVIEKGIGQSIIESICEGENELIIETLSTCSQSKYIHHLNREIEPVLTTHTLQKYTLSCYYHDESGLLRNAQAAKESLV